MSSNLTSPTKLYIKGVYITEVNLENDLYFKHLLDEGIFEVLNDGTIINVANNKVCKRKKIRNTYQRITYQGKGIQAHRLVWIAFNGPIPYKIQINHKDGKKYNNHPDNLELATNKENTQHAFDNGLNQVSNKAKAMSSKKLLGENNINSKITEKEVIEVRKAYNNGVIDIATIKTKYGMCRRAVENMLVGRTYKHVPFAIDKLKPMGKKGKLNSSIANMIRKLYSTGKYTQKNLAEKYGVTRSSIKDILTYRSYKDVS